MPATDPARSSSSPAAAAGVLRRFGRFQLQRLLGKSLKVMAWLMHDERDGHDLVVMLPRAQPADADALERWLAAARKAARLNHPGLAPVVEIGEHDRWPYVAYDRGESVTLAERFGRQGEPAADVARWGVQVLEGLAFAHEAGVVHSDLQPFMLRLDEQAGCQIMGMAVASGAQAQAIDQRQALATSGLQAHRQAAELDVLALGIVLHHGLAGQPALEEPDVAKVAALLPPQGREIVRLPWATARPIPEPLRAIINRATDRQERQRYRSARTFARALSGWLRTDAEQGGGPLVLLLDRLRSVGVLPALPGAAERAARMALMTKERNDELAELVIQDPALSFELLRAVNTASVQGTAVSGNGPVLTVRRAIAMLGLEGVRRGALALRAWPGPLDERGADELKRLMDRVRLAARIAKELRPAGYDAEVVYLIAMLQNLGRLLVQYHFPDEAAQIRRLMMPAPSPRPGEPEEPGMTEEGASFAVLGIDIESLGAAVARHWGLDESVLAMIRRPSVHSPLRSDESDAELLRLSAAAANEVVDAMQAGAIHVTAALNRVVQRYGRLLHVGLRDLQTVAQGLPLPVPDPAHRAAAAARG